MRKKRNNGETPSVRFQFRLIPGQDQDLIDWLDTLKARERSVHVRDALRKGINSTQSTLPQLPPPTVPPPAENNFIEEQTPPDNGVENRLDKLTKLF